ncbi:MAG: glycosyltransferase [Cyanobacteria bacterium]|nr:glycosyltransferase [Cyanobacteriota bacterium]
MNDALHIIQTQILRDATYAKTLQRDLRRQKIRRLVHQLGMQWEKKYVIPQWRRFDAKVSRPKTLSCFLMTMDSQDRLLPLIHYLRPGCDEIVVGVDSKSKDETYALCETLKEQGLIDTLLLIQNDALTCNGALETLVAHCHGDWILRLDDDEFPEPPFFQLKQGILATEKYTHYKFPRLHLSRVSPLEWINDSYLYPDFQMRLFKNDPSLLKYPGAVGHLGIQCQGKKGRLNTINLVHLNMAINPRFKREEKLKKYVLRHQGGWIHPVNEHALLFEDFSYKIEPYRFSDHDFCRLLTQTTQHQRAIYEKLYADSVGVPE